MLFRRGCDIEWVYPMYGEGNEMDLHDLVLYPESNPIQRSSPLHLSFQTTPQESFMGWVQTLTHEYKEDDEATTLWRRTKLVGGGEWAQVSGGDDEVQWTVVVASSPKMNNYKQI